MTDSSSATLPEINPLPSLHGPSLFSGGESRLWADPTDPRFLVKVFVSPDTHKRQARTHDGARHLVDITSIAGHLIPSDWFELVNSFAWPVGLYGHDYDNIDGIRIPLGSDDFLISVEYVTGVEPSRPLDLSYLMSNHLSTARVVGFDISPPTVADRAGVALACSRALGVLWRQGLLVGDLSAKNVLWTNRGRPRVFFLDTESCRHPGVTGVWSPDWRPLDHLDGTIEGERSLFARLVWRIFAHSSPSVMPTAGSTEGDLDALTPLGRSALLDCHQHGTESHFSNLVSVLQTLCDSDLERKNFDWAVSTGYARIVLELAPQTPTRQDELLLDAAKRQALLDQRVRARPGAAALANPEPGFILDVPAHSSPPTEISNSHDLRYAYEAGHFDLVAAIFAHGQLKIAVDSKATRAVRHALAEIGPLSTTATYSPDGRRVTVAWSWPPSADWANQCVIRQFGANGELQATSYCPRDGRPPQVSVGPWSDAGGNLTVTLGVASPSGELIEGDALSGSSATVPVKPRKSSPPPPPVGGNYGPVIVIPGEPIGQPKINSQPPVPPSEPLSPPSTSTPRKRSFWDWLRRRRR